MKQSKKNVLEATWDELSDFEDKEQSNMEIANYALMVIKDEVSDSLDVNLSFNELLSTFHDFFDECRIISKKYNYLKKEYVL